MAELNPGKRSLLIIAHAYLPSTASGVQRVLRMVKYLPENGYQPHVICSTREGVLPGIANVTYVPNDFTNPVASHASRRAERIQRAVLPYNDNLPWAPHAVAAAEAFLAKQPNAIVVTSSPPIVSHFAALRLKKRLGVRWVADFRDPLLGNPVRSRAWGKIYDSLVQRRFMRTCDAAIAVSDVVLDDWHHRYPQWASKFHLIWNGFDPEGLASAEPVPPRSYRVLTHAGTLFTGRFPFWLAESLERLFQRGVVDPVSIKIRLIGRVDGGSAFLEHPAVAAIMAKGCLECDGKQIPRADADRAVATSDMLMLFDLANLSNVGYTVPAKLYDYVRIGRPVLTFTPSAASPSARILLKSGIRNTLVYLEDTAEQIDRKMTDFLAFPTEPQAPSDWFLDNFDGRKQAAKLAAILRKIEA